MTRAHSPAEAASTNRAQAPGGRRSDALMARCATSPAHHFRSPTNADLVRAFRSIAGELTALRIAE